LPYQELVKQSFNLLLTQLSPSGKTGCENSQTLRQNSGRKMQVMGPRRRDFFKLIFRRDFYARACASQIDRFHFRISIRTDGCNVRTFERPCKLLHSHKIGGTTSQAVDGECSSIRPSTRRGARNCDLDRSVAAVPWNDRPRFRYLLGRAKWERVYDRQTIECRLYLQSRCM